MSLWWTKRAGSIRAGRAGQLATMKKSHFQVGSESTQTGTGVFMKPPTVRLITTPRQVLAGAAPQGCPGVLQLACAPAPCHLMLERRGPPAQDRPDLRRTLQPASHNGPPWPP